MRRDTAKTRMTQLFTVAYPSVSQQGSDWIERIRAKHDPQFSVIPAHFTLVFACDGIAQDVYLAHVEAVASSTRTFSFCLTSAVLRAGEDGDSSYVFLVPDDGQASISQLHDHLYAGPLEPFLRRDLPFVPHLTVACLKSGQQAKTLSEALNSEGISVSGEVLALHVGTVKAGAFVHLAEHRLKT